MLRIRALRRDQIRELCGEIDGGTFQDEDWIVPEPPVLASFNVAAPEFSDA